MSEPLLENIYIMQENGINLKPKKKKKIASNKTRFPQNFLWATLQLASVVSFLMSIIGRGHLKAECVSPKLWSCLWDLRQMLKVSSLIHTLPFADSAWKQDYISAASHGMRAWDVVSECTKGETLAIIILTANFLWRKEGTLTPIWSLCRNFAYDEGQNRNRKGQWSSSSQEL